MSLLVDIANYARELMQGVVGKDPDVNEPIFLLLQEKGPIRKVGAVPVLEVEHHVRELKSYVKKSSATGVVCCFNGTYDEPERGHTRAVLLIAVGKSEDGVAEAWPYFPHPEMGVVWGEKIVQPEYLEPYRELFT